jgi:hypothetical protein
MSVISIKYGSGLQVNDDPHVWFVTVAQDEESAGQSRTPADTPISFTFSMLRERESKSLRVAVNSRVPLPCTWIRSATVPRL